MGGRVVGRTTNQEEHVKLKLGNFMDGPDHTEPYKASQGVRTLFIILKTTEGFEAQE